MATTRKIKEAKDLSSGELIYFKGHAGATYMSDGRTVEDAINNINQSGNNYPIIYPSLTETNITLQPNTFYIWENLEDDLILTLGNEVYGVVNEFVFQFDYYEPSYTLSLPNNVVWANDDIPLIDESHIFQVSIVNNCATYLKFKKS